MKTELLDYTLPKELIAQSPADKRTASRLLVLHRADGRLEDRLFFDLPAYLHAGDCLILNNTKVLPARFFLQRHTGTQTEGLFISEPSRGVWRVMIRNAGRIKPGQTITLLNRNRQPSVAARAIERTLDGHWLLELETTTPIETVLDEIGFAPLPPYIKRNDASDPATEDLMRYQTVFAERAGAIAAPTAGLHFDAAMLKKIEQMGVLTARCTLHVGIGTFKPVQADTLEEHAIHSEWADMPPQTADTINATRRRGGRVIAVGTTSVRTMESATENGAAKPFTGDTRLFIMPGYQFQLVDAMITNFHLPRSTLLALVGAFAGMDTIMKAYQHAIEQRYRFYSYGDAMLIL